jgi:hypothetical protein
LRLLLRFLPLAFALAPLGAQVTGTISGAVADASGAAVPGAAIRITSLETHAVRTTVTDAAGNYSVPSLPLGAQEVRVEKAGFQPIDRSGITLKLGQNARVDFVLTLANLDSGAITITEDVPLINTSTSPVAGLVNEQQVKDLPLNGRSFDNLVTLNPGAINYGLKSAGTSTSNGNTFTVSGRRPMDNIVLLNGIEYTGSSQLAVTPGGASGEMLGIDAVREFNLLTDTYPAEYGKRAGGQMTVVTQSGTNHLHGSLFEFLRNSALDARNYFDQGFVPPFRRNQFGGALGGPIRKDRFFLFGNYEGFRQALALSSVSVVPDDQARLGRLPNASGAYTPVTGLNPAMLKYFALWPRANGPELLASGLPSGTAFSYNNPRQNIREDFGTMRADYHLSDADSFTFAYTVDNGVNRTPAVDPLFASNLRLQAQVASVQEDHVFSPAILNTLRLGYSRAAFNFDAPLITNFPSDLAFVTGPGGPGGIVIGGGVTTTGAAALTSAGPNNAANVWNRRNLFTYQDDLQITRGKHQISIGVWLQPVQDNENTASRQLGQASFTSLSTFLQGTSSSFQVVPNPTELGWRSKFGAWYVEDNIRLRRNLTVRLGLRHEFTTGWNEVRDRAANYITGPNGILQTAPLVGHSAFTANHATRLFGPRAALAWDVFGTGRTAIRAGFGVYYSLIDDLSFLLNSLPPYNGAASFNNVSLPSIIPILRGVQPPPSTSFAPQGVQADAKTPAVNEWNFAIEQQLDRNTALRIAYVGSFGYHGLLNIDPNTVPATICASAAGCLAGGVGSARATVPQGAEYIPAVAGRPNPSLGAGFFWYTEANSSYNALQFDVTRRLTHGFEFRANYTWSKSLDLNSALTGAQANNQAQMVMDRNDIRRDWGPSALNAAHQASLSGRYELPFGLQFNAIATLLSGFPVTPQIGSSRSGDGDTRNPDRPSLNPSFTGPVQTGSPRQWFNPGAFILPAVGTYGNAGRGILTGPGLADLDLSLFKTIPIRERLHLQLRAEFFNALNHTNFGTPNAIVFSNGAPSSTAGLITSTATTSRQIQFGAKLTF